MTSTKWKCRHRAISVCSLLALATSLPAMAQKPEQVSRIGWLDGGSASLPAHAEAFKEGLRELGWIDGQNVAVANSSMTGVEDTLDPTYIFRFWMISKEG